MLKAAKSPFAHNPFSPLDAPVLVKVPEAPETHEPRKALRSYLAPRSGGDLSDLAAALGGGRRPKKIIERVRDVDPPEEEPGADFSPPPPPRR